MEAAELILPYVQALAWPIVVLVALVLFRNSIRGTLKRISQFDAFGVTATMAVETRDVEDALALAAKPDADDQERKLALSKVVRQATELGRLQAETGAERATVEIDWSSETPKITSTTRRRNDAHDDVKELWDRRRELAEELDDAILMRPETRRAKEEELDDVKTLIARLLSQSNETK